jgi:hypothetical protein
VSREDRVAVSREECKWSSWLGLLSIDSQHVEEEDMSPESRERMLISPCWGAYLHVHAPVEEETAEDREMVIEWFRTKVV